MISFLNFLIEAIDSNAVGGVHEFLVHKYLGGVASSSEKKTHAELKAKLKPEEYAQAVDRAKHAAEHIKTHIIGNKRISSIQRSHKDITDTSDLIVNFSNGKKQGVSLKATAPARAKKNKEIHIKNPGLAAINSIHNENLEKPKIRNSNHLKKIAKAIHTGFNAADAKKRQQYLRDHIFKHQNQLEVATVHTYTDGQKPRTTSFNYNNDINSIIKNAHNIEARSNGNTVSLYHKKNKRLLLTIRAKYKDGSPNSSIKADIAYKPNKNTVKESF